MRSIRDYLRNSSATKVGSAVALAAVLALGLNAAPANAQWRDHDDDHHYSDHDRDRDRDHDRNNDLRGGNARDVARVNGYAEGYEEGVQDRRNRESFRYDRGDRYRNGTSGYEGGYGNRDSYRAMYRQGFSQGYSDGYYGRSRNRSFARTQVYDNRNSPYDPYSNYPSYRSNPYGSSGNYGNNSGYYGNPGTYSNSTGSIDREDVAQRGAQSGYQSGFERGQYDASNGNRPNPQGHGAYQFGFDGFDPDWGSASTYQQYYRSYFIQGYQDGYNRRGSNYRYRRF